MWKLRRSILVLLSKGSRIRNFFLACTSIFLRQTKIKGDPIILMMEASSRCNLECPMCPRQLKKTVRWEGDMSFDNFKMVIDELGQTLMFLALWNYGEPLLNNWIIDMIRYAKKKGIGVALSTNAVLLTKNKTLELIDSGLDLLIVPLDGATKPTYEMYRKNANFEQTIENIRSFLEERKQRRKGIPLLDLQFLIMKHNEHEILLFENLARRLSVDMFTFKKVVYVKDREKDFLPKDRKFICSYYFRGFNSSYCNRLSLSSVINSNGDVTPCCSDISFRYVFGNVFSESRFRDIWNSSAYQSFRKRAYDDMSSIDICRNCAGANFDVKVYL